MKVLLVRPPYDRLRGYHQAPYFPLGLGYIGAVLEKAGYEVKIWNADVRGDITAGIIPDEITMLKERRQRFEAYQKALNDADHLVWEESRSVLKDFDPDIVGLSVLSTEVGSAAKFSSLVKEARRDRAVIWGGHHATFLPKDVLSYDGVDIVVRGEGEKTIADLMLALSSERLRLNEVKGISYLENGAIHHNPEQELIEDLDTIPFPGHHLSLFPETFKRMERIGIMSNRGCPFRCGYCSSPTFSRRTVRFRSYHNVIDEIRYVTSFYKKNIVSFLDDNFTIDKKRAIELCEHLIKADLRVSWDTMTRADILSEEVVKLLKSAGCCGLTIGIESGSDRILKKINKGVNLDKVVNTYKLLYRYDIPSGANFMAGFPEEKIEDIRETFELMKRIKTTNINFNIFEPIPGSPLLEDSKKMGLVPQQVDWRTFGFWPMNHFTKNISHEEFDDIVFNITQWVSDYKRSLRVRWMRMRPYIKNDFLYPFKKVLKAIRVRIVKRFMKDL